MRIVSGIQPTGQSGMHLGNYLGAIKNWVSLQDQGECFFFIADLHAITVDPGGEQLNTQVLDMTAMLRACGVDSYALFSQRMVPQHTELQWLLACTARMGWLSRMTQFKDKGGVGEEAAFRAGFAATGNADAAWAEYDSKQRSSVGVGLFSYPILQAADVLLYGATHVPVGDDQDQHLQLARDIVDRFHADYGIDVFTKPMAMMSGPATRVMSLKNGSKKMSKSDDDDMSRINLLDSSDTIMRKYKRATTDTLMLPSEPEGLEGRKEVTNLVSIYAALTNQSVEAVLFELGGQGHGALKKRLIDATVAEFSPIVERYTALRNDGKTLMTDLRHSANIATTVAESQMKKVRKIVFG